MKRDYLCGCSCPPGWADIVAPVLDKLEATDGVTIVQVKEKFGGLCIYIDRPHAEAKALITEAEDACARTCQRCGATEDVKRRIVGGWITTACALCV